MERPRRSPSSTPAAGWPAATPLDAQVSQQAERAIAGRRRRAVRRRRHRRRHRRGRAGGRRCCAASGKPGAGRGQQGRRRQPRDRRVGVLPPRPRRPVAVSALHGRGTGDLLDDVVDAAPGAGRRRRRAARTTRTRTRRSAVAIVGRPNVGKSTLFNRLIGDERSVVHDMPGTTRDTIDTVVETEDGPVRFVDTAGMRRKSPIDEGTEYYSLVRALQAIDRADVAAARHRRHRGRHPPGPAPGRAHRRRRLPGRDRAQQVGAARRRGPRRRDRTRWPTGSPSSATRRC